MMDALSASFAAQDLPCFHCGLPVPPGSTWSVRVADSTRAMCCPGCEAIARTIVDNGLADYYLSRDGYSANGAKTVLVPEELQLYDAPEVIRKYTTGCDAPASESASRDALFCVDGIRCGACVWLIERRLATVAGIETFNLNVATGKLHVRWNGDSCKPSDILLALREVGYLAYPFDAAIHDVHLQRAGKALFRQLFIAGLSMMQVMMYAVPVYLATDGTLEADMETLMRWASLLLTIPAVLYSAQPFFAGAWRDLRHRILGMDVPVALGIGAAFGGSVIATLSGSGDVYFDSVTMFIFLLLCSRYLEFLARKNASSALDKLQSALPAAATRLPMYPANRDPETVPATRLLEGDVLLVKPGEAIPADSVVLEGRTEIDLSLLTGESKPQARQPGDMLEGGAINASQPVVVRVTRAAVDSTLSRLVKLIERAGQQKPALSMWADKVAAWFVAALLLLALLVFCAWQWIDLARAWPIAIAVLVVSCPCALSLATPSALAAATDRLLRQGVLLLQPHVLETLHRTTHMVFDKTGTLTGGKPALRDVAILGTADRTVCLQIANALEASSAHPLAHALIEAACQESAHASTMFADKVKSMAGKGIEGRIDAARYRIGSAAYVEEITGIPLHDTPADDATSVYLGSEQGWLARFDIADQVRDDALEVIRHVQRLGKQVILLSGDGQGITTSIARELGIASAYGECLPEDKLRFVQELQGKGAIVAMVGDGINDAAVLRAADVSFAMGSGAALAQTHADAVLLAGRLSAVVDATRAASQTMAVIRQNLAWASLYNAIAIPAAAVGWLNPWLSGIGMSLSSAVVVVNALRLRRIRQPGVVVTSASDADALPHSVRASVSARIGA
ncbi:heavy metal translocating P-type ATPase [Noviherbaspirillum saxi]|uniref:Cadmium-translocating P-type ATPase n=1 Tax=Noviherbaspirillum saxi TaxID=2320863 RepID=A0A3A3FN14_9BURK|nr:heavy metal translocating P-type ATPase [Noviherbaspirillum saxi]RJF96121.1 cadmium-translocating P-type ATPase [Noviherbaspirillum saxi]